METRLGGGVGQNGEMRNLAVGQGFNKGRVSEKRRGKRRANVLNGDKRKKKTRKK